MSLKKTLCHFILGIFLSFSLITILDTPTFANDGPTDACTVAGIDDPLICGSKGSNEEQELQNRIKNVLETVYLWIGIIAVIVIVIGGVKYTTSIGAEDKIKSAKNTITYAVIGLVITLAAFAITEFFIGALEGRAPSGNYSKEGGGNGNGGTGSSNKVVEIKHVQVMGISTIKKGEEYGFYVKLIPDYATDKTITWSSSNPSVATISTSGRLKAISPGKTTITATSKNGIIGSKTIEVPKPIEATSVTITKKVTSLTTGKTAQFEAVVAPYNTENKQLTWSSSNKNIVSVTEKGLVKAVKKGSATITVKTTNNKTDSVTVKVSDAAEVVRNDKVKKFQEIIKSYAWPTYRGRNHNYSNPFADQMPAYTAAYNAAKNSFVSNHDCGGNDCGVFVILTMRNSGWDPNYPDERTDGQYPWLSNPKNGWEDVTSKIKSNADARPGDVIITRGQGHVVMFVGKINGFGSQIASASYCGRTPMADHSSDIMHYINTPHSTGRRYAVFRKKNS